MSGARSRGTIRARLTGAATAVTLLMLAIASVVIVAIQRQALTAGVQEAMRQRADNLEPIDPNATSLPSEGDREDTFAQLLDAGGAVIASSANLPAAPVVSLRGLDLDRAHLVTVSLEEPGGRFRVLIRPTAASDDRLIVIGKNLDDVDDSVRVLTYTLAVACPLLALLLGLVAWWLTGRTLRPVESIRREVQGIHGGELHRRVPVPPTDDEIAQLARTMNSMLERVESASDRQQEFVDDASHELRTPLTRMVTDLEVAIAHPDGEPSNETLTRVLEDATDLQQLLTDLLYLARASHDQASASDEVDLDDIALRLASEVRAHTNVRVDTTGVGAARVTGDRRALERSVRNLLDNAVRHARDGVAATTPRADGESRLVVDDDGDGIAVADRARIFDRFTRLDEARARSGGGAGLGLAIVTDIARRHGGRVEVGESPLGGARFTLVLPSAE
ncbi:MAG: ATP-binding protein [Microthrixaceae bacterium]